MALTGGRHPYDPFGALIGPFNFVYAPTSVAVPTDLYDIVNGIRDTDGIYQLKTGWEFGGLAADGHGYSHGRDTEGIEYENVAGALFEQVSEITRTVNVHMASLLKETLQIIENTAETETVAAATNQAAQELVHFGAYDSLGQYRCALIGYRPEDENVGRVREGAAGPYRPPMYAVVYPLVTLGTEESEFEFARGEAVDVEVQFTCTLEASLPTARGHGFHVYETPGTIAIT